MGTRLSSFERVPYDARLSLLFDLINSFRIVKKPSETAEFLQDLLTAREIRNLSMRLRIAKLLLLGNTYQEIIGELHVSNATITKVSMWLERSGEGFKNVIKKLPVKYDMPDKLPAIPLEFQLPKVLLTVAQYTIAKKQSKNSTKLLAGIKDKEGTDKLLREMFGEYYKSRK